MANKGFTTRILHTPFTKKDVHRSIRMPVYDTAAYDFEDSVSMEATFRGEIPGHSYSRSSNPTIEYLEQTIKNATGAAGVLCLSSGMAAISNLILALVNTGENIITTKHLFGNTYSLFKDTFSSLGIETVFTDLNYTEGVDKLINRKTRIIFLETISNPLLEVVDIKKLSYLAKSKNIPLMVDSTITPLCFHDAKELGIDVEVISSTKYLSGGATSTGGVLVDHGTYNWAAFSCLKHFHAKFGNMAFLAKLRKQTFRNLGACLSPNSAFLQTLGLETLTLRAEKSCNNANQVAKFLENHSAVKQIYYPGLESSPYYFIAKNQFGSLPGALVSMELASKESCFCFLDKLEVIRRATNLNDNKSLALHPASTIYAEYTPEERAYLDVSDELIRLTIGIEDVDDLLNDLGNALG